MLTFREYLESCHVTDNLRGDFIADAKLDKRMPDARTWGDLETHMVCRGACREALRQAKRVWRQYLKKRG